MRDEEDAFTIEDWNEFKSAKTYAEQFEILLKHSEKNQKMIEAKRKNAENRAQNPSPPSSLPPNSSF